MPGVDASFLYTIHRNVLASAVDTGRHKPDGTIANRALLLGGEVHVPVLSLVRDYCTAAKELCC